MYNNKVEVIILFFASPAVMVTLITFAFHPRMNMNNDNGSMRDERWRHNKEAVT